MLNIHSLAAHIDQYSDNAWDIMCEHNPKLAKFEKPRIILNNRLWRSAGICYVYERQIHLGTKFFNAFHERMFKEIIIHELCHQAVADMWGFNPVNGGHCENWKYLMRKWGLFPNRFHDMHIDRRGNVVN